jgi:hypothetical protein
MSYNKLKEFNSSVNVNDNVNINKNNINKSVKSKNIINDIVSYTIISLIICIIFTSCIFLIIGPIYISAHKNDCDDKIVKCHEKHVYCNILNHTIYESTCHGQHGTGDDIDDSPYLCFKLNINCDYNNNTYEVYINNFVSYNIANRYYYSKYGNNIYIYSYLRNNHMYINSIYSNELFIGSIFTIIGGSVFLITIIFFLCVYIFVVE